jgi:hypothetical protein
MITRVSGLRCAHSGNQLQPVSQGLSCGRLPSSKHLEKDAPVLWRQTLPPFANGGEQPPREMPADAGVCFLRFKRYILQLGKQL